MTLYTFGAFQLHDEQLLLLHRGTPVALGPKVVETLLALVEHPGAVVAKAALIDRIWPDGFVEEANLAQNIHVLRRMFRTHAYGDPIQTVPRRGYRFTGAVDRAAGSVAPVAAAQAVVHTPPAFVRRGDGAVRRSTGRRRVAAAAFAAFVAGAIVFVTSSGGGRHAFSRGALSSAGAQSYQLGRFYWNLRTADGVSRSAAYFARVLDTDPADARGYAGLADVNVAMGDYCYGTHRPEVYFARAREYARKALALDPHSADAHAAIGFLALYHNDDAAAAAELQRAIALDPAYGPAREWYGIALLRHGRAAEGVAQLKIAADLDPLSVATTAWLGSAAYRERRWNDAIAYSQQALELSPNRNDAVATLGEAYEAQGDYARAIATFKRYGGGFRYYQPEAAALLAHAYARGRRFAEARAQLAYARAHASEVDPLDLAAAAAAVRGEARALPERRTRHASLYA